MRYVWIPSPLLLGKREVTEHDVGGELASEFLPPREDILVFLDGQRIHPPFDVPVHQKAMLVATVPVGGLEALAAGAIFSAKASAAAAATFIGGSGAGAAVLGAGATATTAAAGLTTLQLVGTQLALSFGLALASRAFVPKQSKPRDADDASSRTFNFTGIRSNRTEGQPIPVIYGRVMTGGQIINENIETLSAPGASIYSFEIALSHGPVYSIGGVTADTPRSAPLLSISGDTIPNSVYFNDSPATGFDDVELNIRLGTPDQEPVDGKNLSATIVEVGLELTSVESAQSTNGTGGAQTPFFLINYNTGVNRLAAQANNGGVPTNAYLNDVTPNADDDTQMWDPYGIQRDLVDRDYDGVIFTVGFPGGLADFGSSPGSVLATEFMTAVRYQALDESSNPITTGGNFGDGWVRPNVEPRYTASTSGSFTKTYFYRLYDPASYTAELPGKSWESLTNNTGMDFEVGEAAIDAAYQAGTYPANWGSFGLPVAEVSFESWFRLQGGAKAAGPAYFYEPYPLFEWAEGVFGPIATGSAGGFCVRLQQVTYSLGTSGSTQHWVPTVVIDSNNSGGRRTYYENGPSGDAREVFAQPTYEVEENSWTHIGVTYKRNVDANRDRLRIFINGHMLYEYIGNIEMFAPGTTSTGATHPTICVGTGRRYEDGLFPAQSTFAGYIDETRLWSVERTPGQMRDSYAYGRGSYGSATQATEGLVCGFHMNNGVTDYSGNNLDATLTSGGNYLTDGIVLVPVSTNVPRRGKWRVEFCRANYDSTANGVNDEGRLEAISGVIDSRFSHPGIAKLSGSIRSSEQLSGTIPAVKTIVEGAIVKVWDRQSVKHPTFREEFTRNTAWIAADFGSNREYGLGRLGYTVDWQSAAEFADVCDEGLYDLQEQRYHEDFGGALPWNDIQYDSAGRGRLTIYFNENDPPTHWVPGYGVGFADLNVPGTVDLNGENLRYEIENVVTLSSTNKQVWLHYDRNDEGTPWTAGQTLSVVLGGISLINDNARIEGRIPRYRYDFDHVQGVGSWAQLQEICSTARTIPARDGKVIRFKVGQYRAPTDFITSSNIIDGSFQIEYLNPKLLPNAYSVDIIDEDRLFAPRTFDINHPSVSNVSLTDSRREETLSLPGVSRRAQAARHARFLLNTHQDIPTAITFEALPSMVNVEVGDTFIVGPDLLPWGVGGNIASVTSSSEIALNRDVVIESGETYYIRLRNPAPGPGKAEYQTATVTNSAGTVTAGSAVTLSGVGLLPVPGAEYLLYKDGDERTYEVTNVGISEDITVSIEAVEHIEAVFDDTPEERLDAPDSTKSLSDFLGQDYYTVQVIEMTVANVSGQSASSNDAGRVELSWGFVDITSPVEIYAARIDTPGSVPGQFERVHAAAATDRVARIQLPPPHGGKWAIAFQATDADGKKQPPEACPQIRHTLQLETSRPKNVNNFSVEFNDGLATYSWTGGEKGLGIEARVGGWVLGQVLFRTKAEAQDYGPTKRWVEGGPVYYATVDRLGQYSSPEKIEISPTVYRSTTAVGLQPQTQDWQDFGDGWVLDTPGSSATPTLSGLERDSDTGYLQFSGSDLEGTYTVIDVVDEKTSDEALQARKLYVSAVCEAYQRFGTLSWENARANWSRQASERMSWEGPSWLLPGETAATTLSVQIRINTNGLASGWSEWLPYRAGVVSAVSVQFRLVATRASTDHDIEIRAFRVEVSAKLPDQYGAGTADVSLINELYS